MIPPINQSRAVPFACAEPVWWVLLSPNRPVHLYYAESWYADPQWTLLQIAFYSACCVRTTWRFAWPIWCAFHLGRNRGGSALASISAGSDAYGWPDADVISDGNEDASGMSCSSDAGGEGEGVAELTDDDADWPHVSKSYNALSTFTQ